MKISVICPTRDRKDMLCRGIDSAINSICDTSKVEFLFRFDEDDMSTIKEVMEYYDTKEISVKPRWKKFRWGKSKFRVIETISRKHNLTMKFLVGHRHRYHYMNRYHDELIHISEGEYIVFWSDDLELVPNDKYEGWDSLIREGEGQLFIFFFRAGVSKQIPWRHPQWPEVFPRKLWEINGRFCPNALNDWWPQELCKVVSPDVRVILDWECHHHCLYKQGSDMDKTCLEGRMAWDDGRESTVKDYEYYDYEEMLKIKEYIDKHPNTKRTSQYHDTGLSGQEFDKAGATGRWKR